MRYVHNRYTGCQSFQSDHSMSIVFLSFTETSLAHVAHGFPVDNPEAHQVVRGDRNDEGERELLHHLAPASPGRIPEEDDGHRNRDTETRPQVRDELPSSNGLPPREPISSEVLVESLPTDRQHEENEQRRQPDQAGKPEGLRNGIRKSRSQENEQKKDQEHIEAEDKHSRPNEAAFRPFPRDHHPIQNIRRWANNRCA